MNAIRLFTDEDICGDISVRLRAAGYDVISTPEAGRLAKLDEEQLVWSAQEGRTLLTFNISDFARLHSVWMRQGLHHDGLILSRQWSVGEVLRRMLRLLQSRSIDAMKDRLEYLSNWPPL